MSKVTDWFRTNVIFTPPQWHWYGWRTLFPLHLGYDVNEDADPGDEKFCQAILTLGWTVTGRVGVGLWHATDDFPRVVENEVGTVAVPVANSIMSKLARMAVKDTLLKIIPLWAMMVVVYEFDSLPVTVGMLAVYMVLTHILSKFCVDRWHKLMVDLAKPYRVIAGCRQWTAHKKEGDPEIDS